MADWNPNGKASPLWYLVGIASGIGNIAAMIYILVSKSQKKLFSLLYLVGFFGPLIAYFLLRKDDPKLASISLKLAIGNILFVVVYIIILASGIFSSSSLLPATACIPAAGYLCYNPLLSSGTFSATIGQSTGVNWVQANLFVVAGSYVTPTAVPPLPCETALAGGLDSGQTATVALNEYSYANTCAGFPAAKGSAFSGIIWAAYKTSLNGTVQFAEVGTVALKGS